MQRMEPKPAPPPVGVAWVIEWLMVRPLYVIFLVAALTLVMLAWFFFGVVWLAMLARAMAAFACASFAGVYRGTGPADPQHLYAVVAFWPQGFAMIISRATGRRSAGDALPRHPLQLLEETVLAFLLFASLILLAAAAPTHVAWLGVAARAVWSGIVALVQALQRLLPVWPW